MIDKPRIENAIREIILAINDNPTREGLIETPQRVARMYAEIFAGQNFTNDEIADMFNKCFTSNSKDIVILEDIKIFSFCEHHLALMYDMNVSVAYFPNRKIIGLSKIVRIVEMVGKRLQLQERIGNDIAYILTKILDTEDVFVKIAAKHSCVTMRGIKNSNVITTTYCKRGRFFKERIIENEHSTIH